MTRVNDWMYKYPCPICEQPAGARCVTKTGRHRSNAHNERVLIAIRKRPR